jgi:phosphoglycerate dehydrogenase-like enzyme
MGIVCIQKMKTPLCKLKGAACEMSRIPPLDILRDLPQAMRIAVLVKHRRSFVSKPKIWYLPMPSHTKTVFPEETYERFLHNFDVTENKTDHNYTSEAIEEGIAAYDGLVTGWGSPAISETALKRADRLKILAHSAGSVKHFFTQDLIDRYLIPREVCVVSANGAIALNVAEHTVGSMIMMSRRWIHHAMNIRERGLWNDQSMSKTNQGLRGSTVGLISASTVAREVIGLLQPFNVHILIYDPYLSDWEAGRLGVEKTTLKEVFKQADIVSVHAPKIPETDHMLGLEQLRLLKEDAVFINTSRGSVLDHEALYQEAKTGRFQVQLDVTDPEPLPPEHPLRKLSNVVITPHTSGGGAYGYSYIGNTVVQALEQFFYNKPVPGRVNLNRWALLA